MVLSNHQQQQFEKLALYCNSYIQFIPISFVLGERHHHSPLAAVQGLVASR